jgi:hypothetical protein
MKRAGDMGRGSLAGAVTGAGEFDTAAFLKSVAALCLEAADTYVDAD